MSLEEALRFWQKDLNGPRNNTYKFVLQQAILKNIRSQRHHILYEGLSHHFIETYWNNEVVMNLRESVSLTQEAGYNTAIREVASSNQLNGIPFKKLPDQARIIQRVHERLSRPYSAILQNPIARLQQGSNSNTRANGAPDGSGWLYDWSQQQQSLILQDEWVDTISQHIDLFAVLLVNAWARYIEPFNLVPAILTKLSNEKASRSIPVAVRREVNALGKATCFYCDAKDTAFDIDHFLPFAYVNHHEVWNLVLACQACNRGSGGKFERLPEASFREKILSRNRTWNYLVSQELQGWEDLLNKNYINCVNAGFQTWSPSPRPAL
jgi:hypothetical protein